jgi:predicted nucleotidyltransferase
MVAEASRLAGIAAERFPVRRVFLFGSVADGRGLSVWSDIDLAVEGLPAEMSLELLGVLTGSTRHALDVKRLEELPPAVREHVASRGVMVYERR